MALQLPMPPRVALLACGSGGDYQFDEATGLVAAMVLGGAQLVTATLWSLPTTAAYRQFATAAGDPMADVVAAVDRALDAETDAGCAVNLWQREQMRRWRDGDPGPARCIGVRWSASRWTARASSQRRHERRVHRKHVVGQRKFLARSGIERHQDDQAGTQHRHVEAVAAAGQLADEGLPETATTSMNT